MRDAWLAAGEPYPQFWTLTPAEVVAVVNARRKAQERAFEEQRVVAYELARLTAFAHHDPKNIPEYKPANAPETGPNAADYERVRGFFMGLAMKKEAR